MRTIKPFLLAGLLAVLTIIPAIADVPDVKLSTPITSKDIMYALQDTYRGVADEVLPEVVEINVTEVIKQRVPNFTSPFDFFRDSPFGFFGPNQNQDGSGKDGQSQEGTREIERRQQGLGSGVIVRKSGKKYYVVTNNHVVGNADEINIKLYDGREYEAKLVGKDSRTDLALVSFETKDNLQVATLSKADNMRVGDIVFAVGNPLGFESSITQGIISALGRKATVGSQIADFTDYIQTDASINPGNSGGALVNLEGDLVGINTWIASQSGGSVGIGFAIPVDVVERSVDAFIKHGKIEYGWLGVSIGNVNEAGITDIAKALKIDDKEGAFVSQLFLDSPAYKGGILPGDLIIKVDNIQIKDKNHLTQQVGSLAPGTVKDLTVIRNGKTLTLPIKFEARDEKDTQNNKMLWPGFFIVDLDKDVRDQLKLNSGVKGVVIAYVINNSRSQIAGIKQGDIITRINGKKVSDISDFYQELNQEKPNNIQFEIYRNGSTFRVGL
ncbi:Do family serine endopeptidase [Spirochaeta cellobiosiphila]|uniref:Do family serine endopeptidase n=1 Tax=Spirochaeta cellobiosiphila TaxID=504483 RepID=UPI00040898B9|nr:Do family serine endopeptidase [Spirochaeta cellobiosiphila]